MTPAIELVGVDVSVRGRRVLQGVDLVVPAGHTVAVLGPSGSGKSTLLRAVLGLEVPQAGVVRIKGRVVSEAGRSVMSVEERNLAVVFQDLALWPHLTVRENLTFALEAHGVPPDQQRARMEEMLARMHLADKATRHPGDLSGGERQRVAIARALVMAPGAVLLDEPLANLDARLKRELLLEFRALFSERQVAALYVTHDLREAMRLAERIVVLEEGRVVQQGTTAEVTQAPATDFIRHLVEELHPDAASNSGRS